MSLAEQDTLTAFQSLLESLRVSSDPEPAPLQPAFDFLSSLHLPPSELPITSYDHVLDSESPSALIHFAPVPSTSTAPPPRPQTDLEWLYASLPPNKADEALEILKSPSSDTDIADSLLELWGYEGIDKVAEAVSRRSAIIAGPPPTAPPPPLRQNLPHLEPNYNSQEAPHRTFQHHHHHGAQEAKRDWTPHAQVTFQSKADLAAAKTARRLGRHQKGKGRDSDEEDIDLEEWERIRQESLAMGPGALVSGRNPRVEDAVHYPNVYLANGATGSSVHLGAQKMAMPIGTMREDRGEYEEITIPAPKAVPFRFDEALLPIDQMDPWGQRTFHAYKTLNRLQSIVFPVAYKTNENMLVCAPTGAGKTDVALLTILRCLSSLASTPLTRNATPTLPPASAYKIIYVAPLKALAAEITLKFSKRLSWAGVKVRELTGDMKLTKKEVEETGVIVTTPEKWDVVTRKGAGAGDGEVADKVKLLIIDEVHLLHEDRGAVIESIVARTLRQVESSQSLIRIVGLSATLPNYVDVADFLRVNRYQGLFYFDASFRPVPLEQHFLGVKGKPGSVASRANLDSAAFNKVADLLKAGHQVMVFVHARKDTVKTAQMLREKAMAEGIIDLLDPSENDRWGSFKRDIGGSRNREMKELAAVGFGIHHAGMLRSDRNITERMFEANVTKVLCCTATLAWGVNLPAYAVVIKGTQVYDSGKGAFVDLSILDVLQIFGRAGRPQYESQGVGYICTTSDKLDHYVSAITQQHPIESKFVAGLVDSLNAEISLGTVTNVDEGVRWLGYSYLFVRMRKNPLVYGMVNTDVEQDPMLGSKRLSLITISAKRLVETQMIKFDPDLGTLVPTDLGRIASRYYIRNASIEIFNKLFRPRMSEADVLALIASSVEFDQINVRENEVEELQKLIENSAPCQVKGGTDTSAGKVNVLLQTYISRAFVEDFALVSDMGYVSQNAGRIVRALLEIAMSKRWAPVTLVLMSMSKAIEKRMWPFSHPLAQFDLPADLMYNIERWADDMTLGEISAMTDADFGALIHQNERLGGFATRASRQMPSLIITHSLQPIAHDLLRIRLELKKSFDWSEKLHGTSEAFWIWIEDEDGLSILQVNRILIRPSTTVVVQEFVVPMLKVPTGLHARVVSDRWMGNEEAHFIALDQLVMPPAPTGHLLLLDLPLLSPQNAFKNPLARELYMSENSVFNPVETQAFHTLFHTSSNALVCAPSASSRGTLLELSIWRIFDNNPNSRVLFLTPRKALARQVSLRLRLALSQRLGTSVHLLSRAQDFDTLPSTESFIAVSAPTPLLQVILATPDRLGQLDLIIAHDLHALLPAYELVLSRLRWKYPDVRVAGSSASLIDATDLAAWLDVPEHATYAFRPSARSLPLVTSFQSFSTPHSLSLLKSMVRPAYAAMRVAPGSTICFVPSRAQCRSTARDLVTQTAADLEESFIVGSRDMVETYAQSLVDADLAEALSHGIAVFHEGMRPEEQRLALELFGSGAVRVLITSREAAWTLPVRASLIIVMSAQFAAVSGDNERHIEDYPLPDLLQMQSLASPPSAETSAECLILCQAEQAELYGRFLLNGLPLESELPFNPLLASTVVSDLVAGHVQERQDIVDIFSWTYFARRLASNPSYYSSQTHGTATIDDQVSRVVDRLVATLESRCFVLSTGATKISLSSLGKFFESRSLGIEEVARLQAIPLDRMVDLVTSNRPLSNGNHSAVIKATNLEEGDTPIKSFHQRLPRAVRDAIGTEVGPESDKYEARVLLAAFAAGRVPRGVSGLELAQVELIKTLVGKSKELLK